MMLSLVQHASALRKVRVHPGVIHEVVDEHVQTTQVSSLRCDHLVYGLEGNMKNIKNTLSRCCPQSRRRDVLLFLIAKNNFNSRLMLHLHSHV